MEKPMNGSVRQAFQEASSFLQAHGVEQAEAVSGAEWLLRHLLGWERSTLFLRWHEPFPQHELARWQAMLARRAGGEPVQYIIGEQEFFGLRLQVGPAVLVPRPETELLVEQVLLRARAWADESVRVIDVGTGSGAIPISLAVQRRHWQFVAVDISPEALKVAALNAELCGVAERIRFVHGDGLRDFVSAHGHGQGRGQRHGQSFEIVVSNPPYIPTAEIASLQREVQAFEPHVALDGGGDGLHMYRQLIEQISLLPQLPRLVAFEIGHGQGEEVAQLLAKMAGRVKIDVMNDLAGLERMVFATTDV